MRRVVSLRRLTTGRRCAAQVAETAPRQVEFVAVSSAETSPKVAVHECLDIATAALGRPPNFCWFVATSDHSQMREAPEHLWHGLRAASPNAQLVGALASHQRIDNGYLQILAGCVPDLVVDAVTLDRWEDLARAAPVQRESGGSLNLLLFDGQLTLQNERLVARHLHSLHAEMPGVTAGAVLPPATPTGSGVPSVAVVNDKCFTGSALVVRLYSPSVSFRSISSQPAIHLASATLDKATRTAEGDVRISEFSDGRRATDLLRSVYETHLTGNNKSRVFLGVRPSPADPMIALSCVGDPSEGSVTLSPPPELIDFFVRGAEIAFLCDDPDLDEEAIGAQLVAYERAQAEGIQSRVERVAVRGEGTKEAVVSSAACIHFTHAGLLRRARPDSAMVDLLGGTIQAPSIAARCLKHKVATSGLYCPAPIVPLPTGRGDLPPVVSPRSALHLFIHGLS